MLSCSSANTWSYLDIETMLHSTHGGVVLSPIFLVPACLGGGCSPGLMAEPARKLPMAISQPRMLAKWHGRDPSCFVLSEFYRLALEKGYGLWWGKDRACDVDMPAGAVTWTSGEEG